MSFLSKLQTAAQELVASADNMVDSTKLGFKINEEKKKITAAKTKLGDMLWQEVASGAIQPEGEIKIICQRIQASLDEISRLQAAEEDLHEEEAEAAEPAAEAEQRCRNCNTVLAAEARFCSSCGTARS